MKTIKSILYILSVVTLVMVASCKSSKKAVRESDSTLKSHAGFFERLEKDAFQFETLSARLKVNLDLPNNSMGSRVDLKMVKDKAFQLSVQPFLGIEVCRILVSTDSIIVLDRMNKRYVAEDLAALKGQTPVEFNFYNLQALFTNHVFLPGKQAILPKDYRLFSLKQDDGNAEVKVRDALGIIYQFSVDKENKLTETYIQEKTEKYSVRWMYTNFRVVDKQIFPMNMQVQALMEGKRKGGMEINYNKIELDKPVDFDFSIPSKYTRITFNQIVKSLTRSKK
ncbi:DUF4292 domain-containing protein [Parabacteroides pacaensis]|uniref:DUF4292 domain-containing protein n=1 Tax=Parabacteroides pacaensis TaxID=2086575 RepID=UPI000D0EF600|nr:DUF4292 domain-containing protein [Parabacteroides pacaensis]